MIDIRRKSPDLDIPTWLTGADGVLYIAVDGEWVELGEFTDLDFLPGFSTEVIHKDTTNTE